MMFLGNSRVVLGGKKQDIFVGGFFTTVGGITTNRVAAWNGSKWEKLNNGIDNNYVYDLLFYKNNLILSGAFTAINGSAVDYIAEWNGSSFSEFESGANSSVWKLHNGSDGNLYVGGQFTTIGGISANRIAKWDGSSWSAFSGGVQNLSVFGIYYHEGVVWNQGGLAPNHPYELYVGGNFTTVDGSSVNRIARWNGSQWDGLGSGANLTVRDVIVYNGDLYMCGEFTSPGNRIAKWNGSSWSTLGTGLNGTAYGMTIFQNELIVTGTFTSAGGSTAYRIAKWNGSSWSALGGGIGGTGGVNSVKYGHRLRVYQNKLYVVGSQIANNGTDHEVRVWDGNSWSTLGSSFNSVAYSITSK